jgi:lycopene beta-cyclase
LGSKPGTATSTRGPGDLAHLDAGWQKFVGLLLNTDAPHGLTRPIVMDATVKQIDGYRFVYVLPFGPNQLFVEDTYYSDSPQLDVETVRGRVLDYAAAQGWRVTPANRMETGVLPVVIGGDFDAYWQSTGGGVGKGGMRAGLFHPTTGYSLPDAVRLASAIARAPDVSREGLARLTREHGARAWKQRGFYRMLDTMLFRAAHAHERYRIMERFYTLSEPLIGRFYAANSTAFDKLRILTGKPPIPIPRALGAILRTKWR